MQAIELLHRAHMRVASEPDDDLFLGSIKNLIRPELGPIEHEITRLYLPTALHRIGRIEQAIKVSTTNGDITRELQELFDAVRHDTQDEYFCHYKKHLRKPLDEMSLVWRSVFKEFGSIKTEVEEGVDCYALSHNTACVFHMCRAAEAGLRAIARERGIETVGGEVPVDWGTWGKILEALDKKISEIRGWTFGPKRDQALRFYTTICSDLRTIQNYRDNTMHFRDRYDEGEAQSAMFRVREMMTVMAEKLSENSTEPISWDAGP